MSNFNNIPNPEDNVFVVRFKHYPASIGITEEGEHWRQRVKLNLPYAVLSSAPLHYSKKEKYNYIVNSVLDGCTAHQIANLDELITNDLY